MLLLAVTAMSLNVKAGMQARMAANRTVGAQTYFDQVAVIEQSLWKLTQDPSWRVPVGENYAYHGRTYSRRVFGPNTVTYPDLASYADAVIISVRAPNAIRTVNKSSRYNIDSASPFAVGTTKSVHVTSAGHIYFADIDTHSVWRIDGGTDALTRAAGNGTSGYSGDGGPATAAQLAKPMGVLVDSAGNIYIGEYAGHRVRRVNIAGTITTIAGTGVAAWTGDGGLAVAAALNCPQGLALDPQGNLLIADSGNHVIRKITTATGIITTIAGTGAGGYSGDSGPATSAKLNSSEDVDVDGAGNIFIADTGNNIIRKIDAATQIITKLAGAAGLPGFSGDGGNANAAKLNYPSGIAVDVSGNIYIADENNCRIRKITASDGKINTIAGNGTCAYAGDGGQATSANINYPKGVAVRSTGDVIISDAYNKTIRKVDIVQIISTFPGTVAGQGLNGPAGITPDYDTAQKKLFLYIADTANNRIRKLDTVSRTVVTVAGTGTSGSTGDNGLATSALLSAPQGVFLDTAGNIYIADTNNHKIRKVTAATGIITTVAGTGIAGYSGDGGQATLANLKSPKAVFADSLGNVYIADSGNNIIRKVTAATGSITLFAGGGGFWDNPSPTQLSLSAPEQIFVDAAGNVYFADTGNHRIRKVSAAGVASIIAGTGTPGYSGDGGSSTVARLRSPRGVAVDAAGNIYIVDSANHCMRLVNIYDGTIKTMAGTAVAGYSGDLQPAIQACLSSPARVALGLNKAAGRIYISDTANNRIRVLYLKTEQRVYGP